MRKEGAVCLKTVQALNRNFSVIEHLKSQLVIAVILSVLKSLCLDQGQWGGG